MKVAFSSVISESIPAGGLYITSSDPSAETYGIIMQPVTIGISPGIPFSVPVRVSVPEGTLSGFYRIKIHLVDKDRNYLGEEMTPVIVVAEKSENRNR